MSTHWTIERIVDSAPAAAPRFALTTTAARKIMLEEMANLGITTAPPSLRALAYEESAFYFVRHPDAPDRTYVRVVAERI
jgi:hypothetical protein